MKLKSLIAAMFTPPIRLATRYLPSTRRQLWNRVLNPYFAWRDYQFLARTQFGALMQGNTSDVIQRYIYYFGIWEPNVEALLQARLQPGDVFIDVGANIGYFTLLGAKLVGLQGRVVSIEASTSTMRHLKANIARNHFDNRIRCVHAAASDSEGTVILYEGQKGNIGSASIVRAEGQASEEVRSASLEKLLEPNEIESARIIKIDVEGAEWLVFRGMQPLLSRLRADAEIVMEINPELSEADRVVELLARGGWNAYALMSPHTMESYFLPAKPLYAARISSSILTRTDVMFSRIQTDRISYKL